MVALLSSCGHYRWFNRNRAELCQLCQSKDSTGYTVRDTVIYVEVPADSVVFDDFQFDRDTAFSVGTGTVQVVKYKDRVVFRYKPIPVAVAVAKIYEGKIKTITVDKIVPVNKCRYWWLWMIAGAVVCFGVLRAIKKLF